MQKIDLNEIDVRSRNSEGYVKKRFGAKIQIKSILNEIGVQSLEVI